jgi:nucleoside-diphosphate-sugar epimerase
MTKKKYLLVTGAAGFIGSNMVEHLLKNTDYNIVGIDNFQNNEHKIYNKFIKRLLKNDRFVFFNVGFETLGSFGTSLKTDDFFYKNKIEVIFHFAATPRVSYSVQEPIKTNKNNITNSLTLLEWAKNNNVKRFVFSSSSSVYGDTTIYPTPEYSEKNPKSPYALQKYTIESYCKLYSNLYNLDTVCLRYFNVYGKNQYAENAYATVICAWIKGFLTNTPIRLDGDGTQSRDFTYVTDICSANLLVGLYNKKFKGKIFNVAGGNNYSLQQILDLLTLTFGKHPKIIKQPSRAGDVNKTQADASEIGKLGFKTKINLEKGLKQTVNWYKKNEK